MASQVTEALREVYDAILPFTAAVTESAKSLTDLTAQTKPFVAALSPATINLFDQTIRNLNATIGVGLLPIFTTLIDVVGEVSGILLPAFQEIAPIIQLFANAIGDILIVQVRNLVAAFEALKPILQILAFALQLYSNFVELAATALQVLFGVLQILLAPLQALMDALQPILTEMTGALRDFTTVLQAGIKTLVQTLGPAFAALFGSAVDGARDGMRNFVDALKEGIRAIIGFAARIALMFGGREFIDRLLQNLERPAGQIAAPQNVGIKSFEQIAKDLAVASVAAGAGQQERDVDFLRQIQDDLRDIRNNAGRGFEEIMIRALDNLRVSLIAGFNASLIAMGAQIARAVGDLNPLR